MLSNSCRYGIRAVIYLARHNGNGMTGIGQISNDLDLPAPFLAKILQKLARHRILVSSKGPHGGFSLLRDPKKITLFEIVKTIDGDEFFTHCVMHNGTCGGRKNKKKLCPLHDDYQKIREDLVKLFGSRTIQDLVVTSNNREFVII